MPVISDEVKFPHRLTMTWERKDSAIFVCAR